MKRNILSIVLVLAALLLIAGCKPVEKEGTLSAPATPEVPSGETQPIEESESAEEVTLPTGTTVKTESVETATIEIIERRASPLVAEVSKGTTVTWVNKDTNLGHVIIIEGLNNERKRINPGESYSYTFENTGNYRWLSQTNQFTSGYVNVK